jgi:cation transport regulator ChaC
MNIEGSGWIQAIASLLEFALLLGAVYLTIYQFRRTRASAYIERFNSRDVLESRVAVDGWLRQHDTASARLEALERDPHLLTQVRQFANLFQELGAAYQFRVAHRRTVCVLFDALVVMYWEALRFWVYDYRARLSPTLYARFEYLYRELQPKLRSSEPRVEYVVGYGSLMDPASVGAALGRGVAPDELIPITLLGFTRSWSIGEQVRLASNQHTTTAAFLDVTPEAGSSVRAVMFRVGESEMQRLVLRERNYTKHDVTRAVRLLGGHTLHANAVAWCFLGKESQRLAPAAENVVILEGYLARVTAAAARLDPSVAEVIGNAARASGFRLESGTYRFTDAVQATLV